MSKIQGNSVIEKCGECKHIFDNFTGEYEHPCLSPYDFKYPECSNMPMTNGGTFPDVDPNKLHKNCPLQSCEVVEPTGNPFTCSWVNECAFENECSNCPFEKIIAVKKSSHGKE